MVITLRYEGGNTNDVIEILGGDVNGIKVIDIGCGEARIVYPEVSESTVLVSIIVEVNKNPDSVTSLIANIIKHVFEPVMGEEGDSRSKNLLVGVEMELTLTISMYNTDNIVHDISEHMVEKGYNDTKSFPMGIAEYISVIIKKKTKISVLLNDICDTLKTVGKTSEPKIYL